VLLHLTKFKT